MGMRPDELATFLHVGKDFGNKVADSLQGCFGPGGQPGERGEFGTETNVLAVLDGPGHTVGVAISLHGGFSSRFRFLLNAGGTPVRRRRLVAPQAPAIGPGCFGN